MKKNLNVAPGLALPLDTVTETIAVLAKRGAGKTHTSVVLGEELLKHNLQTVIVDPVGVWWGLRSSKDGKKNGLPIMIMGGEHGDVPLESTAGSFVARLVVEEGLSVLLDLSLMRKGPQRTFVADFAEELYRLKARSQYRTPMHIMLDEADAFAPQKVHHGMERCLGAIDDLVRRGRARGLGVSLITQRAAVLNKDVLSQAEILIALRTTAPQDRKAVEAWTDIHGEEEQTDQMMGSLPKLPRGHAWVWWPHNNFFKLVEIRDRTTFDSSKTPKVGEKVRKPKKLAPVDLKRIHSQMQEIVERAKQEDPKELRKQIAQLKKGQDPASLLQAMTTEERLKWIRIMNLTDPVVSRFISDLTDDAISKAEKSAKVTTITVPAIDKKTFARMRKSTKALDRVAQKLRTMGTKIVHEANYAFRQSALQIETMEKVIEAARKPPVKIQEVVDREIASRRLVEVTHLGRAKPAPDFSPMPGDVEGGIKAERKLLQALVGLGKPATRTQLAIISGLSPSSGTYGNYLGRLRGAGYVHDNGGGIELGPNKPDEEIQPMEVDVTAVQFRWMHTLKAERKLLQLLLENGPQSRNSLAALAGLEPSSGTYGNYLGRLRGKGVINRGGPRIEASPYLIAPSG